VNKNKKIRLYDSVNLSELLNQIEPVEHEKTSIKMVVSANIFDLMEEKNISRMDFIKHFKISDEKLSYWLSGCYNFTLEDIVEISDFLKIETIKLLNKL